MLKLRFSISTLFLFTVLIFVFLLNFVPTDTLFGSSEGLLGWSLPGNQVNSYTNQSFFEILSSADGEIPILMYHNILTPYWEENRFTNEISADMQRYYVTSDELRSHLEKLYEAGFVNISLDEYLSLKSGEVKTLERLAPGKKLYVLTFDDATFGQLDYSGSDENGNPLIDTNCAVGIMIEFARLHPEFKLNAAFSIDFENTPFIDDTTVGEKMNLLLDYGFEIVNHTATHCYLGNFIKKSPERVSEEIGLAMELFESYLGYRVSTIDKICYPGGKDNDLLYDFLPEVQYNGKTYTFTAALDAEGMLSAKPGDEGFNAFDIDRIEINSETFEPYVLNAGNVYESPQLEEKAL